jgi:hypothetical protein
MVAGGIDEDVATEIVRMLAAGKIPHVAISY